MSDVHQGGDVSAHQRALDDVRELAGRDGDPSETLEAIRTRLTTDSSENPGYERRSPRSADDLEHKGR